MGTRLATYVYLWYLAAFFFEWFFIFGQKLQRKSKNTFQVQYKFFRKSYRLWHHVENYGTAKRARDDNIIQHMRFVCWMNKATYTHSEYEIIIAFLQQQWLWKRAWILC